MSKALLRYTRLSPTKARLIAREIQGMNAELALATLEFTTNKAAKAIYKVLASAIANGNYDAQSVIVKSCRVDAGPVLRRMTPKARGRGAPIRKPTSHITVEVAQEENVVKKSNKSKDK
ncbi:50S ribosomal protein L22 [Helicobacter sp. MIT 14-3879]|uniref:50S ribosomal protein L22 n=1 Tax=Helicobacter sp. MIT 14-3879 TaxID=2040649 RepID=UPI000E1E9F84|nr:50S ribosomal protein L22 [Helicobacter sp. MIT 14-3879]RDU64121.1 50S ribosomal protein L22 [Helicobacter sp. MIT 14-3879]